MYCALNPPTQKTHTVESVLPRPLWPRDHRMCVIAERLGGLSQLLTCSCTFVNFVRTIHHYKNCRYLPWNAQRVFYAPLGARSDNPHTVWIIPTQYTHLVWTRRLRPNQRFRRLGVAGQSHSERVEQPQLRLVPTEKALARIRQDVPQINFRIFWTK